MSLIDDVYAILSPLGVPVLWQLRPTTFPGLTYHFFNESGDLYGNGVQITGSQSCQVDIWSKGDYSTLKSQVKAAMKAGGFRLAPSDGDKYESDVQLFHCILIFNKYHRESEG